MPTRKGSKEEGSQLNECAATPNGSFSEPNVENVDEMKPKKRVKVKPVDRVVNITRKALRSGSVAMSDRHHVAVEEKRKSARKRDISKADYTGETSGRCSVGEVKEEAKREHVESPVLKETHGDDCENGSFEPHGDEVQVDVVVYKDDEVKEEVKREHVVTHGDDCTSEVQVVECKDERSNEKNGSIEPHRQEVQVKRKRGRPQKLQISSQSDDKEEKVICVSCVKEEKTEVELECEQSTEGNKILGADSRSQVKVEVKDDRSYDEYGNVEPHYEEVKVKRKRGRPRKLQITSQSDTNCKLSQSSVDRLSLEPQRGTTPNTEENVNFRHGSTLITLDQSTRYSIDRSRKPKRHCGGRAKGPESDGGNCRGRKMGRKRGRPPKPKTKKKSGETDESDCKATKRLKLRETPLQSRNNNSLTDGEMNIGEQQSEGERRSILESKKKLSDRILQLLLAAGWTVEYRPRNGRAYKAAVYVNPEGKTHWSVTKAYQVYKIDLERTMKDQMDSTTVSGFGLVPEEELDLLRRKTQKKRSDKGKQRSNWKDIDVVSIKAQKKRKGSHGSPNLEKVSLSVRKIKREEKHNRKRGALSARSSLEDPDSKENGYILFEGKRTMLGWMIDSAIVPLNGKVQCMNCENTEVRLEGIITKQGIRCSCCNEVFSLLDFEVHSGEKHRQPFKSLYLEDGNSLLQCFLESWNKQSETVLKGFHIVDFGSGDQSDDTCAICGDGGDLTCCDGCPSTFHQNCLGIKKFPSGSWFCCNCSCKFCEKVEADNHVSTSLSPLLRCSLCEEKYHQACVKQEGTVLGERSTHSFCGKYCQELFEGLQLLIGVKQPLPDGFSWTFLRRFELPREVSDCDISENFAYNAKLAVAFSVMDECFSPLVDHRSGVNLLENIVYNFGSNFHRLNYSNFLTAVLESGDEIIAVASIRIHGNQLAEMPFIGTRYMYRRQGMCRRLMNGIESALGSLKVDKLVIPAVPELMDTWTSGFGFTPVHESAKKTIKNLNLVVFPGVDMLEKPLAKEKISVSNVSSSNGDLLLAPEMSLPVEVEETKPEESKDEQNCATNGVESISYPFDSCLKSLNAEEGDNHTYSNLKLLNGYLKEKEEIIEKLTDKDVNNQRESNSGVADESHADQTDTKRHESDDFKGPGVEAKATEESDEHSDCYIIEHPQPLGATEKKIGNKALPLNTGVASRLRVSTRLIRGKSWRTSSRVKQRYIGNNAVLLDSPHRRCV